MSSANPTFVGGHEEPDEPRGSRPDLRGPRVRLPWATRLGAPSYPSNALISIVLKQFSDLDSDFLHSMRGCTTCHFVCQRRAVVYDLLLRDVVPNWKKNLFARYSASNNPVQFVVSPPF